MLVVIFVWALACVKCVLPDSLIILELAFRNARVVLIHLIQLAKNVLSDAQIAQTQIILALLALLALI